MTEMQVCLQIEILFKLIVKVPVVGNTTDTPNPPWVKGSSPRGIWCIGSIAYYRHLSINLNSISIPRVLVGSTTIYLYVCKYSVSNINTQQI